MTRNLNLLIAESESAAARDERRQSCGRSSAESFADTLRHLAPGARLDLFHPAERGDARPELDDYDGVFLAGSPLHAYHDTAEVRAHVDFVRAVFAAGVPSFGACAGLQLAVVAAGGTVRPNPSGHEVGFARRITPGRDGSRHPLLDGRPAAYDALAVHSDEVASLPPDGARALAGNAATPVQAAEIRHGAGTFWGVQYHPELPLGEVAAAVRRQADGLVERGLARSRDDVATQADLIASLDAEPDRLDLAWRLGLDAEVTEAPRRRRELSNFILHLVAPTRAKRGRG